MILYFGRLLCLMPKEMVKQDYVVAYLKGLTSITQIDAATEQTIRYSLSNVLNTIGDLKLEEDIQFSIRNTRDWLLAIQSQVS